MGHPPHGQAHPTAGHPAPALVVTRNPFGPIPRAATPPLRDWSQFFAYPPPSRGPLDPVSELLAPPPRQGPVGSFNIEKMTEANAAYGKDFASYLSTYAPEDEKLRQQITSRTAELKQLIREIEVEDYTLETTPGYRGQRDSYEDFQKREELEHELFELQERATIRLKERTKVINSFFSGTYQPSENSDSTKGSKQGVPITNVAPWWQQLGDNTRITEVTRDVHIPDWFAVFDSYGIVALSSRVEVERWVEFLNINYELEQEQSNDDYNKSQGIAKSKKADMEWHEASLKWKSEFAQKRGG